MAGDKVRFSTGVVVDEDGRLGQVGELIQSSRDEIDAACDISANVGNMAASTVVAASADTAMNVTTQRTGNIIKTTMIIYLKDLKSTTTLNDIIGDTGASHFGQITEAINGAVYAGQVSCAIVPTTGDDDIDISIASVDTGAYDADVTGLTNYAQLVAAGAAHAIGTVKPFTALPTADYYLYLSAGAGGSAGTYGAGTLIIEMWGLAA